MPATSQAPPVRAATAQQLRASDKCSLQDLRAKLPLVPASAPSACRAQRSMNSFERFVELRTIKSYARHEFPEAARRFAAAVYTDTAAWEQTHGAAKQSGSFVNNHGGTDGQVKHAPA